MSQYFTGKKASSYGQFIDPSLPNGKKEIEYRACAHCGVHWEYETGSGKKRGICLRCNGLTCGKMECSVKCEVFEKRLDLYEAGKRTFL